MTRLTNILLWLGFSLTLIIGIIFDIYGVHNGTSRIHNLPLQGLGYTGYDMSLNPSERSLYSDAEVLKRCYQLGKDKFVLIAIDGARNRHAVHDPIYCFQGAGWSISSTRKLPIEGGSGLLMNLQRDEQDREILYWFTNNKTRHSSVVRYWIQATIRRITLGRSGQEPILIMMQSLDNKGIEWAKILDEFGLLFEI
ncbi:MAG TPA: exosortase-associated EpsI family protein [Deltaproteobacteria bacterium]|nr:exosortase-associated EpsI family protein [Deltaproteobacteria bacterium]